MKDKDLLKLEAILDRHMPYLYRREGERILKEYSRYLNKRMIISMYDDLPKESKLANLEANMNRLTVIAKGYSKILAWLKVWIIVSVGILVGALGLSIVNSLTPVSFTGQVFTMFIFGVASLGGSFLGICTYVNDSKESLDGLRYTPTELLEIVKKEHERVMISDE